MPLSSVETDESRVMEALSGGLPQVELPRRPMLEEASPLLRLAERERPIVDAVAPVERPETIEPERPRPGRRSEFESSSAGRERPAIEPLTPTDDWLTGQRSEALSGPVVGDELFAISWEGIARTKLSGALPEFPPGVNRTATIRLAFAVNPAGDVVTLSPVVKGVPELERVSIDALRTWRFNALDRTLPQADQRGEITFIFKLR
ncbi:MAG: hypothetical protein FJY67_07810 [Calditrichaeota bacterium]|nr:hypothetical protein [Calditrichota bacterium]